MRGLTFPGEREVAFVEFPDPTPGPGEVVIEMKASGMCGSDLHLYRASKDLATFKEAMKGLPTEAARDHGPLIVGHEPCGVVADIGAGVNEREARIGERVMVHHYWGCAVCDQCRSGWPQICEGMEPLMYGTNAHGGHARYMKVPARTLVPLPDELSFEAGAAIACGSGTSYSALRRLNPSGRHTVAIFGQGPVGLSGTQFAVAMGARVIALDINPARLQRAKAFGADAVINPEREDAPAAVRELTHGFGADFALETSGAPSGQLDALHCLRTWGTVAFVGVGGPVQLKIGVDLIRRQITAFGSLTFSSIIQKECARFSVDNKVMVDAVFTDRWTLDRAEEAYRKLDSQSTGKGVFLI